MQVVASLLILITLTCPVTCRLDDACCARESGAGSTSQKCCQHCSHEAESHEAEGSSTSEEIPRPPVDQSDCDCFCLCAGAVLTESTDTTDLSFQPALLECGVSAASVEKHCPAATRFSRVAVPPAAFGAALRLLECSLRS